MGNCIETCLLPRSQQADDDQEELDHGDQMETTTTTYPQKQRPELADDDHEQVQFDGIIPKEEEVVLSHELIGKGDIGGRGSLRVKIVLTKEELQWLMMQLQSSTTDHNGEQEKIRLETMLQEIDNVRKKVVCDGQGGGKKCIIGWKPSLESIMETPPE